MKIRIIVSGLTAAIALCASAVYAGDDAFSSCESEAQSLPATGCTIAWKTSGYGSALPWEADRSADSSRMVAIKRTECFSFEIDKIHRADRMALVSCKSPKKSEKYWVNLDSLNCFSDNAGFYRDFTKKPGCNCEQQKREEPVPKPKGNVTGWDDIDAYTRGKSIVQRAEDVRSYVQRTAGDDQFLVMSPYLQMDPLQLFRRFEQAKEEMRRHSKLFSEEKKFGPNCDQKGTFFLDWSIRRGDESVRGQRTCRLVKSAFDLATEWVPEESVPDDEARELGAKILKTIRADFARSHTDGIRYQDLSLRMLMFYGMPEQERKKLMPSQISDRKEPGKLAFVRTSKDGGFVEFHNGYVFGGSRLGKDSGKGYDCSDFIASILGGGNRGIDVPNTSDLRAMALQLAGMGDKSIFKSDTWSPLQSCFEAVDLRKGQRPLPGDVVISRNDALVGGGHVVVVKSVDYEGGTFRAIEAVGGGKNTLTDATAYSLFEPPCAGSTARVVRPDVYVLRFKPSPGGNCPLEVN